MAIARQCRNPTVREGGKRRFRVDLDQWLGHSDARQVSDLPKHPLLFFGSPTRLEVVTDRQTSGGSFRQVRDLPRIGVA